MLVSQNEQDAEPEYVREGKPHTILWTCTEGLRSRCPLSKRYRRTHAGAKESMSYSIYVSAASVKYARLRIVSHESKMVASFSPVLWIKNLHTGTWASELAIKERIPFL